MRALFLLVLVACGPSGKTVSMRMSSNGPHNASVTIDDHFVGTLDVVSSRGIALPVGVHHITVEAAGFLPWDKRVEATDAPVKLDVRMTPVPD